MSEQPVSTPARPPKGGKIFGVNRTTAIVFGVALAGGIAWFLYKRHKSGTATGTATAGTPCTDASGNAGTYDASGNCVSTSAAGAGVDYSGELSTIQTELESVLATSSIQPPAGPAGATGPAGAPGSTGTTGATGAGTFPLPAGRSATPYATYVDLGWTKVGGAVSYHYQVLSAAGASVHDASTAATSVRVTGLKPKTAYKWRIAVHATATQASSPWSPDAPFTTK